MPLLYFDPVVLEHDTGRHPENAGRLTPLIQLLDQGQFSSSWQRPDWGPIDVQRLLRVHPEPYVTAIQSFCAAGGGNLDPDTVACDRSYHVASIAAGAVADAVARVAGGEDKRAFCVVRPPGHHALESRPMGFCLFNSVAVGCRVANDELDMDRVLVVDWDVHHGNGTQAIFWEDPRVAFFSIHRWPFYPGTGDSDETGAGEGLGSTLNLPIEFGISRRDYLATFAAELQRFADAMSPQLVIISAGFDAHRTDPIGSLGLESEDFIEMTRRVIEIADVHAEGRVVSVLEGGYNPAALSESVQLHLNELAQ